MRLAQPTPPLRFAVAAVLVAAGVACAPGRAAAGCGDYVHIADQAEPQDNARPPTAPATPQPCHGPGCSGRPTTPTVPLTPPVTSPTEGKGSVIGHAGVADPAPLSAWPIPFAADEMPVRLPSSIFHPPRSL